MEYLIEPRRGLGISGVNDACFGDSESIYVIQDAPFVSRNLAEELWCADRDDVKRCIVTTFDNAVQFLRLGGVLEAVYYDSDSGLIFTLLALWVQIKIRVTLVPYCF
jgi:hypothetical protein